MATHEPAMQVDVEEAVREMLAVEVEAEEQDPFEGMGNAQVAEIYHRMKPEDQRLFRQFKGSISSTTRPTGTMPQATS